MQERFFYQLFPERNGQRRSSRAMRCALCDAIIAWLASLSNWATTRRQHAFWLFAV